MLGDIPLGQPDRLEEVGDLVTLIASDRAATRSNV